MKTLLRLFIILLVAGSQPVLAQPHQDTIKAASPKTSVAQSVADDDDFNAGLLVGAVIVLSVMLGFMIVGFVAASLIGGVLFILVSSGILSAAILVGAYKKSIAAGFRTLLIITFSIGGIFLGIGGLYLVNILFDLHLHHTVIAWSGLIGGLIGGVVLGLCLFMTVRLFLAFAKRKLSF
jgi:hypothetical protein